MSRWAADATQAAASRAFGLGLIAAKGPAWLAIYALRCTRSRSGRTVVRHRGQYWLDKARRIAQSAVARADLKRRQHFIECSFADAANCHGLKRARWRGLWKQAIQDLLIATVQKLRKLVRHLSQIDSKLLGRWRELLDIYLLNSCPS